MAHSIALVTFVVRDYDKAVSFFTDSLRFTLVVDTPPGAGKRWVVVAPPGSHCASLLLTMAATSEQLAHAGLGRKSPEIEPLWPRRAGRASHSGGAASGCFEQR